VVSLVRCADLRVDSVLDFSWEPKGERFAIVSSSDPNLGNPGPGITIKTDVSFYQLDHGKNDFRLLRKSNLMCPIHCSHGLYQGRCLPEPATLLGGHPEVAMLFWLP